MPKLTGRKVSFFVASLLDMAPNPPCYDKSKKLRDLISLIRLVDGTIDSIVGCSTKMCPLQAGEFYSCCQVWNTPENGTTVLLLLPDLGFWYFCWKCGSEMVLSIYLCFSRLCCSRPFLQLSLHVLSLTSRNKAQIYSQIGLDSHCSSVQLLRYPAPQLTQYTCTQEPALGASMSEAGAPHQFQLVCRPSPSPVLLGFVWTVSFFSWSLFSLTRLYKGSLSSLEVFHTGVLIVFLLGVSLTLLKFIYFLLNNFQFPGTKEWRKGKSL